MNRIVYRQPVYDSYHTYCGMHYWGFIDGEFVDPILYLDWPSQQYIGREDINNLPIYEGDIVKTNEADWIAQVYFHNGLYGCKGLDGCGFSFLCEWDKFEVVGNIFANPEMLKE